MILVIVLLFLLHAIILMTLVLMQLLFRCTGTVPFFLLLFLRFHLVLLANRQAGKQNIHCDEVRHAPVDAVLHRDKAFVGGQQRNIRQLRRGESAPVVMQMVCAPRVFAVRMAPTTSVVLPEQEIASTTSPLFS